jgi:hypothetical protein
METPQADAAEQEQSVSDPVPDPETSVATSGREAPLEVDDGDLAESEREVPLDEDDWR